MSNLYEQYRQTSIQTAPPEQLVVMLYDGAIRFLEQAKVALRDGKDPVEPISRAQDIIVELLASLNRSAGDLSDNLSQLYEFWIQRLFLALARHDATMVDEVSVMVRDLRESWAMIAQQKRAAAVDGPNRAPVLNARG